MKLKLFILAFSLFVFNSCNSVQIFEGSEKIKGIPFYVHKEITEQTTQYQFRWYEVELVLVNSRNSDTTIFTYKVLAKNKKDVEKFDSLKIESSSTIKEKLEELAFYYDVDTKSLDTISNTCTRKKVVDYSKKYYINQRVPLFGSSTLSQKLSEDGTLTEVSATADNQIDELVTGVVGALNPLASIKVAEIAAKPNIDINPIAGGLKNGNLVTFPQIINYKLKIKEKGYLYTFKKSRDSIIEEKSIYEVIPFDLEYGNYTRVELPIVPPKKEEDKSTIKVSADIKMPSK